jgi:hypothetical protein
MFALRLQTKGLSKDPMQVTGELHFDEKSFESEEIILHMQSWAFRNMQAHMRRVMVLLR